MKEGKEKKVQANNPIPTDKIVEIVIVVLGLLAGILFDKIKFWAILINVVIVVIGIFVLYYINNKNQIQSTNQDREELSKIIEKLKHTSQLTDLLKYVCGSIKLMSIEGSVGNNDHDDQKVFVQSSKFELETTNSEFFLMLINNLRKGVQYYYLIPKYDNKLQYESFYEMVISWWNEYSKFLYDKNYCTKINNERKSCWQKRYIRYVETASDFWRDRNTSKTQWKSLYMNVFNLFKERLFVYTANESLFYIVTAIYQVEPNKWKAIVKLPTEYGDSSTDDYYSFVVFGEGSTKSNNSFITRFQNNFTDSNIFALNELYDKINQRIEDIIDDK